jgi:2-polyprenyl-3-methyl-5-hydroxy-6-metoxy-1,4-benzoquinol methylase
MNTAPTNIDRSREMEERSWWDLWNMSYRAEDDRDAISTQLFNHVATVVHDVTKGKPARVLEIACGAGTLSRKLSFATYHGLDLSKAAIEHASVKAREATAGQLTTPTYEVADFHEWQPPAEPFDVIVCVDAAHAFRDQKFVLRKMAQILHPDGHLVIATINRYVYDRIRRVGGVKLESGPVSHWLSKRELHDLVEQAPSTIVRSYTIMPRGNMGMLRVINSGRLTGALGPRGAAAFDRMKERVGFGQYRVVIARKG